MSGRGRDVGRAVVIAVLLGGWGCGGPSNSTDASLDAMSTGSSDLRGDQIVFDATASELFDTADPTTPCNDLVPIGPLVVPLRGGGPLDCSHQNPLQDGIYDLVSLIVYNPVGPSESGRQSLAISQGATRLDGVTITAAGTGRWTATLYASEGLLMTAGTCPGPGVGMKFYCATDTTLSLDNFSAIERYNRRR